MLTDENLRFARQGGATHIVAHLVDYFRGSRPPRSDDQPTGSDKGWGIAGDPDTIWTLEELVAIRRRVESHGLTLEAIENFDPAHWHDILLDGPKRAVQVANVRTMIERVGQAGIPLIGYNFSLAGVAGRTTGRYARGSAVSVGMEGAYDTPMPAGMVWNMVYDPAAAQPAPPPPSVDELWRRLGAFLSDVLPAAERAGVRLALHPDDPPMPTIRGQHRLVYQPNMYNRVIALDGSRSNAIEFCVGSVAEMTEGDVYEAVDEFSRNGRIGYVHLRNVVGKVPYYRESFIDDGDVDMLRVLCILQRNKFDGVIIPDHCPQMECGAPWHAGMAFALGYIRSAIQALERQ